ncbi:MAG: hypothetical protein ABSB29_07805 [Nitrososphaerales archaeon]|jgi:hypothetical protein
MVVILFLWFAVFLVVFLVIVVGIIARAMRSRSRPIQRPTSESTAFPPPPPPDSVLVKCQYCGTAQPFRELCSNCGAPLPKPEFSQ